MLRIAACLFCVLRLCLGTEALTETLVELGCNATLNCSLNVANVHWYLQRHPQPPLAILRSFTSSSLAAFYSNNTFRQKYSLLTGNGLLIQNVTVDDCGVFYCAKKENDSLLFSNGTRLMTTVDSKASEQSRDFNTTCLQGLLIGSGFLNAVLILMVSAISVLWKRAACQKNPDSPPTPEPPERADSLEVSVVGIWIYIYTVYEYYIIFIFMRDVFSHIRIFFSVCHDTAGTPTERTKARLHCLNYLLQSSVSKS
uniref:Ig-like domain-containing protein n=1 Tax=Hucho hucho TaxID=62062 RepID=A0A4W5R879_9TELE